VSWPSAERQAHWVWLLLQGEKDELKMTDGATALRAALPPQEVPENWELGFQRVFLYQYRDFASAVESTREMEASDAALKLAQRAEMLFTNGETMAESDAGIESEENFKEAEPPPRKLPLPEWLLFGGVTLDGAPFAVVPDSIGGEDVMSLVEELSQFDPPRSLKCEAFLGENLTIVAGLLRDHAMASNCGDSDALAGMEAKLNEFCEMS
jgi:hypothetical protein